MDVVYSFRYDSKAYNKQLKYSLRSVEKHLKGVRRVFVIGFPPQMPGVIHVEHTDLFSAAKNILSKIMRAVDHVGVSEDFLYMADDHYLLQDVNIQDYPYYVNGTLTELLRTQKMGYGQIIKNTIKALAPMNSQQNYNVHCPIIFNKAKLIELSKAYDFKAPLGFLTKSLYMNHFASQFKPEQIKSMKDCKLRTNFEVFEILKRIEGRDCFSTGHEWECPNIVKVLEKLYPEKSKYE